MKAFERAGWTCSNKLARDAHYVLHKDGHDFHLSIPNQGEVKRALLQKQIKNAGMTDQEYRGYFDGRKAW